MLKGAEVEVEFLDVVVATGEDGGDGGDEVAVGVNAVRDQDVAEGIDAGADHAWCFFKDLAGGGEEHASGVAGGWGRGGIGAPVERVDTYPVATEKGANGGGVADAVETDGDSRVNGIAGRDKVRGIAEVVVGDGVTDGVRGHEQAGSFRGEVFPEQVDDRFGSLAVPGEDEGTTAVVVSEIVVESGNDVTQGYRVTFVDQLFTVHPRFHGDLAVVGGKEVALPGKHVFTEQDGGGDEGPLHGIKRVHVVMDVAGGVLPIPRAGRYDVEHVGRFVGGEA